MSARDSVRTPILLIVITIASFLFFFKLGERSFRNPDEGRYAQIAKHMVVTGDWIEPKVFSVDYLRKPPLFYWLTALSFKTLGFSEYAARFVPALFGLLGVLVLFLTVGALFDAKAAAYSALILATNIWYLQVSRYLIMDAVFTFFVVSALLAFFMAQRPGPSQKNLYASVYFLTALAFLCKGPVALVLVGLPALLYLLRVHRLASFFKEGRLLFGIGLFALTAGPWFYFIRERNPEFINYFFLYENVSRFTSSGFEHQEPWYFYLVLLPAVFFPWIFFAKDLFRKEILFCADKERNHFIVFCLLAAGVAVGFYSLSKSKLATYILPAIPFLSAVFGVAWQRVSEGKVDLRRSPAVAFFVLTLFIGFLGVISADAVKNWKSLASEEWTGYVPLFGSILLTASFLILKAVRRNRPDHVFHWIILMLAVVSLPIISVKQTMNKNYTTKAFAESLKPRLRPEDTVFVYDSPGPFYDFGFYLDHPAKLVGLEGEVELYKKDRQALENSVTRDRFEEEIRKPGRFFCLMRRSDFKEWPSDAKKEVVIIKEDEKKVLFAKGAA